MPEPRYESEERHRCGHTEIGYHLTVIGEGIGDYAVKNAENDRKKLTERIALGIEDKEGDPDKRRGKGKIFVFSEKQERGENDRYRARPQKFFKQGKIIQHLSHKDIALPNKKNKSTPYLPGKRNPVCL